MLIKASDLVLYKCVSNFKTHFPFTFVEASPLSLSLPPSLSLSLSLSFSLLPKALALLLLSIGAAGSWILISCGLLGGGFLFPIAWQHLEQQQSLKLPQNHTLFSSFSPSSSSSSSSSTLLTSQGLWTWILQALLPPEGSSSLPIHPPLPPSTFTPSRPIPLLLLHPPHRRSPPVESLKPLLTKSPVARIPYRIGKPEAAAMAIPGGAVSCEGVEEDDRECNWVIYYTICHLYGHYIIIHH